MQPKKFVRRVVPKSGVRIAEESYRRGRIYALQARYGFPARKLKIIGVTGTNGKTTTCLYLNEILKAGGYKTAMYTTATIELNGKSEPNHTHRTLPLTGKLLAFLKKVQKSNVDYLILEVTSQALDQHKLLGIPFEVSILTNLTQEHLDYHGTMKRYAKAKARLFNTYADPKFCVLNADSEWYDYFLEQSVGQVVSYGTSSDATERIKQIKSTKSGMSWQLLNGDKVMDVRIPQYGEFNVTNASAAATAALALQVKPKDITTGVKNVKRMAGRMELVDAGQPFKVWIDYAVTPDALEKVLAAGRQAASKSGRVIIVFGATGDRDKAKRPKMGEVVAKHADKIYLTDDETYTEDPAAIRKAVMRGIVKGKGKSKTKTTEIADRQKAIAAALKAAKKGDVVIITGIGHQNARNMGGKDVSWNERKIIENYLTK
ncbi:MAG: UDP-N-acetylmuramoyl-L-alanyl-D-glutamate--2,6-diaminopimelate ligase [Candidatus Saccharibacteria bacterium]|nr:UDP-N-acetylmuramoyl-L-alanyl-D-glutamate--2,6-diaminopimelate ligase [Candidatus Saccharibacteria bacterium]